MTNVAVKISIWPSGFRRLQPFPDASMAFCRAVRTPPSFPPTVWTRGSTWLSVLHCPPTCPHLCSQGEKEKGRIVRDCLPAPLRLSVAIFRRKGLPSACKLAQRCVFCSVGTAALWGARHPNKCSTCGFWLGLTKTQGSSSRIQA